MARVTSADRKRHFVEATIKVISEEGVARATTRRIAEVAKAPAASLHYCFESKEELFRASFEQTTRDGLDVLEPLVTAGMGLREGAEAIMVGLAHWIRDNPQVQMAQFELTLWSLRHADSRYLADDSYRRYLDGCAQLLRRAADGTDPAPTDELIESLSRLIIGALDGMSLQWLAFGDASIDDRISEVTQSVLSALAPPTSEPQPAGSTRRSSSSRAR